MGHNCCDKLKVKRGLWSPEEDERLRRYVTENGHNCCDKLKVKRGLWSPEEDERLRRYVTENGHNCWSTVPKHAGLQRCGKSCRLRWINYLRPDIKRGNFSEQEERTVIDAHRTLGNRWSQIAKNLPGRTDNEVKNYWNSCIKKKLIAQGIDPKTHCVLPASIHDGGGGNTGSPGNPVVAAQFQSSSGTPFTLSSRTTAAPFDAATASLPPMAPAFYDVTAGPDVLQMRHDNWASMVMPGYYPYTGNSSGGIQSSMNFMNGDSTWSSSMELAGGVPHGDGFNQSMVVFTDEAEAIWDTSVGTGMGAAIDMAAAAVPQQHQHGLIQQEVVQPPTTTMNVGGSAGKDEEMTDIWSAVYGGAGETTAAFDLGLMESTGMFCGGAAIEQQQLPWDY